MQARCWWTSRRNARASVAEASDCIESDLQDIRIVFYNKDNAPAAHGCRRSHHGAYCFGFGRFG